MAPLHPRGDAFDSLHDPTTLNCPGNGVDNQYRSGIYLRELALEPDRSPQAAGGAISFSTHAAVSSGRSIGNR